MGINEQPSGDCEVEILLGHDRPGVLDPVFNAERFLRFLSARQVDHSLRNVEPDHLRRSGLPDQSGVAPFATSEIEDWFPSRIADSFHERVGLDSRTVGLGLGLLVLFRRFGPGCSRSSYVPPVPWVADDGH
nr:hypothetical protein [Methylococcus geothermalis]